MGPVCNPHAVARTESRCDPDGVAGTAGSFAEEAHLDAGMDVVDDDHDDDDDCFVAVVDDDDDIVQDTQMAALVDARYHTAIT